MTIKEKSGFKRDATLLFTFGLKVAPEDHWVKTFLTSLKLKMLQHRQFCCRFPFFVLYFTKKATETRILVPH